MSNTNIEAQIRALIETWVQAVRRKDINQIRSMLAPDFVGFEAWPPLHMGSEEYCRGTEEWLHSWEGPIGCEMRNLEIAAGDDVAFSHDLTHFYGTKKGGEKEDMWIRATVCYRKVGGKWLVTHEHVSEPFDMETSQALLDLEP
jgi:uncharacterized protein (TIGR02246 family)